MRRESHVRSCESGRGRFPPATHPIPPGHPARDEQVLDLGTGSGVNAVLAATRGAQVLAVDINPAALDAASADATRNSVDGRVEVRHSDVFDAVEGCFDLIMFDPPLRWFPVRDIFEAATADPGYRSMTPFFAGTSGAGKTSLAARLGEASELPHVRSRPSSTGRAGLLGSPSPARSRPSAPSQAG